MLNSHCYLLFLFALSLYIGFGVCCMFIQSACGSSVSKVSLENVKEVCWRQFITFLLAVSWKRGMNTVLINGAKWLLGVKFASFITILPSADCINKKNNPNEDSRAISEKFLISSNILSLPLSPQNCTYIQNAELPNSAPASSTCMYNFNRICNSKPIDHGLKKTTD